MSHDPVRPALPALAALVLFAAPAAAAAAPSPSASPAPAGATEERVAALEARVAALEAYLSATTDFGEETDPAKATGEELMLPVVVTRKHFQHKDPAHAVWEDWMDMDVQYDTSALDREAVALKGTLVFSDAFGEVRLELPTEVMDQIAPGTPLKQKAVRFKYNQFRDAHQWFNATDPKKMQVAMRLSTVMYRDGTTVKYH